MRKLLLCLALVGCGGDDGGAPAIDGGDDAPDGTVITDFGDPGNPSGSCAAGVPSRGQLVDTSTPTAVIGDGTAASCTAADLQAAITAGGVITFDCGPDVATIAVTETLVVPEDRDTVIDGGLRVVLDGGGAVQILHFESAN